jgi:hypothetical protein
MSLSSAQLAALRLLDDARVAGKPVRRGVRTQVFEKGHAAAALYHGSINSRTANSLHKLGLIDGGYALVLLTEKGRRCVSMAPTHTLGHHPVVVLGPGHEYGCTTQEHRIDPDSCVAYHEVGERWPVKYTHPDRLVELSQP